MCICLFFKVNLSFNREGRQSGLYGQQGCIIACPLSSHLRIRQHFPTFARLLPVPIFKSYTRWMSRLLLMAVSGIRSQLFRLQSPQFFFFGRGAVSVLLQLPILQMPLNPISLDEQERQSKICISCKIHFFNESRSHLVWLHLNITCAFKNAASKTLENVHWNIYSIAYHSVLYIHCVHISILLFHTKSMHQCTHVPFSKSAPLPPKF